MVNSGPLLDNLLEQAALKAGDSLGKAMVDYIYAYTQKPGYLRTFEFYVNEHTVPEFAAEEDQAWDRVLKRQWHLKYLSHKSSRFLSLKRKWVRWYRDHKTTDL